MVKSVVIWIANNPYLHLFLGAVVLGTALIEVWDTLVDDITTGNARVHHGITLLGVWHMIKAAGEIIEAFDFLEKAES